MKAFLENLETGVITYYPRFYRDVLEMRAILEAHGAVLDVLQDGIERTYLNNFIDYADERTIADFERFIGIRTDSGKTLDQRHMLVKSYLIGFGKISASVLSEIIKTCTGNDSTIRFEPTDNAENNSLLIDIDWQNGGMFGDSQSHELVALLGNRIPAHINWHLDVKQSVQVELTPLRVAPVTGDAYVQLTIPAPDTGDLYGYALFVEENGDLCELSDANAETRFSTENNGDLYYWHDETETPTFSIEDGKLYEWEEES